MGVPQVARDLQHYLQQSRDAVVASLDGLAEHDVRRPLTATGTNLLGLVKHLASVELGYLGDCVGRPTPVPLPWNDDGSVWENADLWATPGESREELLALYRTAWAHSDASIDALPLDHPAHVPWWREGRRDTTFGHLLARCVDETARHAGQIDTLREVVLGVSARDLDLWSGAEWDAYVARVQQAADPHRTTGG